MRGLQETTLILAAAALAFNLAPAAQAGHSDFTAADSFTDYAQVVSAEPVYETVLSSRPSESCWNERVRPAKYYRGHGAESGTPVLIGALIGGALGNELGHHKSNKRVGAVLGGLLGGSIARDVTRQNHAEREHYDSHRAGYKTVRRCETTYEEVEQQQLVGYDVSYRYRGQLFHTRTAQHPGKKVPLRISVSPAF